MKENTNIDINTIKILYKKYKEHLVYILVISITTVLFLFAVLPRIVDLTKLNNERKIELNKISILKNNLDLLSNLDNSSLDSQLLIASSALPSGKDFEGVLNAVSLASGRSGVSLDDYGFQVGDLSQRSSINTTGFPFLTLVLNVRGTTSQIAKFVGSLFKSTPISEVTSIVQNTNSAKISVVFYYKALPGVQLSDSEKLTPLSQKGKEIINIISSWGVGSLSQPQVPVSSTSSASPF